MYNTDICYFFYSFYCTGRTCGDNSDEVGPRPNRGVSPAATAAIAAKIKILLILISFLFDYLIYFIDVQEKINPTSASTKPAILISLLF
ncbi:MAG: hypothetical protein LBG80_09140, partial [Bacteroidales bacterium]|nr:hypothetical protein [Bacteroidales bacterium]